LSAYQSQPLHLKINHFILTKSSRNHSTCILVSLIAGLDGTGTLRKGKFTSWYVRIHNFNFAAHVRPARWSRL